MIWKTRKTSVPRLQFEPQHSWTPHLPRQDSLPSIKYNRCRCIEAVFNGREDLDRAHGCSRKKGHGQAVQENSSYQQLNLGKSSTLLSHRICTVFPSFASVKIMTPIIHVKTTSNMSSTWFHISYIHKIYVVNVSILLPSPRSSNSRLENNFVDSIFLIKSKEDTTTVQVRVRFTP
jgi:hypothetical protein